MTEKLFPSEINVMNLLWEKGDLTAGQIAAILGEEIGWSKTTTYTIINKCIKKGAINRSEPNFVCSAAVSKSEVQMGEVTELVDKFFGGASEMLVSALISDGKITAEQLRRLQELVDRAEGEK